MPTLSGHATDRDVVAYTGTVIQSGSRISRTFRQGDHVEGLTRGVGKEGGCFDEQSVAKGAEYHNKWERVKFPPRVAGHSR